MATFVPKEREILIRHPVMEELKQLPYDTNSFSLYGNDLQSGLSERDRVLLSAGYRPQRVEFYTRHNPHPTRVRHMKGLLDAPICCVEDNTERRLLFSPPSGEEALKLYKNLLDSTGRSELEQRTKLALSKALIRAPPTPVHSRGGSQQLNRHNEYSQLNDDQILELLCQILQTDSVAVCKAWIEQASEAEKAIVLNMLGLAASGVISYPGNNNNNAHHVTDQQKGVWHQHQSHVNCNVWKQPCPPNQQYSSDGEDPIVTVARQLSRLASHQDCNAADEIYRQLPREQRKHLRSASMEQQPTPIGRTSRKRLRSLSANTISKATFPPPPVSVKITKQQLQEPHQYTRPPTRLRYVSTWN